jgi:hypothetical protein
MSGEHQIRAAAKAWHANVRDLQAGRVSADEHRAVNRRLRESFADPMDWERAKATAMNQL